MNLRVALLFLLFGFLSAEVRVELTDESRQDCYTYKLYEMINDSNYALFGMVKCRIFYVDSQELDMGAFDVTHLLADIGEGDCDGETPFFYALCSTTRKANYPCLGIGVKREDRKSFYYVKKGFRKQPPGYYVIDITEQDKKNGVTLPLLGGVRAIDFTTASKSQCLRLFTSKPTDDDSFKILEEFVVFSSGQYCSEGEAEVAKDIRAIAYDEEWKRIYIGDEDGVRFIPNITEQHLSFQSYLHLNHSVLKESYDEFSFSCGVFIVKVKSDDGLVHYEAGLEGSKVPKCCISPHGSTHISMQLFVNRSRPASKESIYTYISDRVFSPVFGMSRLEAAKTHKDWLRSFCIAVAIVVGPLVITTFIHFVLDLYDSRTLPGAMSVRNLRQISEEATPRSPLHRGSPKEVKRLGEGKPVSEQQKVPLLGNKSALDNKPTSGYKPAAGNKEVNSKK